LFRSAHRSIGTVSTACALGAAGLAALPVSAAQAGLLDLTACNTAPLSPPFAPWGRG
jgi:hypothetical protein